MFAVRSLDSATSTPRGETFASRRKVRATLIARLAARGGCTRSIVLPAMSTTRDEAFASRRKVRATLIAHLTARGGSRSSCIRAGGRRSHQCSERPETHLRG